MIDVIISIIIGIVLGFIAGIIPGLHPNFIGVLVVAGFLDKNTIFILVPMLVSSAFFEFIRSIFLFVPDEGHVLAMHPIFKFVSEGKSLIALKLVLFGLIFAIFISIIMSPLLIVIVPPVFMAIKGYVPFALIIIAGFMILRDEHPLFALAIFLLAGALGYFGLQILKQPLLILLTGFFGFPILFQIKKHVTRQIKSYEYKIPKKSIARGVASAFGSALMLTFIPAVGPAQASVFTRGLLQKSEDFLISIGALSGFDIVFSLLLLYSVQKARIGILEVAGKFFKFDLTFLIVTLLLVLAVALFSYFITLKLGKFMIGQMERIDYKKLAIAVVVGISIASFYFDSFAGLFFLFAAAGIGLLASRLRTNMTHCMGSLMIPTLIYYLV